MRIIKYRKRFKIPQSVEVSDDYTFECNTCRSVLQADSGEITDWIRVIDRHCNQHDYLITRCPVCCETIWLPVGETALCNIAHSA